MYGLAVNLFIRVSGHPWIINEMNVMAVQVVEFSKGGTKLERFLPKNQHTQRKLLNFENWISMGLRSFKKLEF